MGLQIQFIDRDKTTRMRKLLTPVEGVRRFELRQENNDWIVPELNLVPINGLPLISRVEIQISGSPATVVARLQAAFPSQRFTKPMQLAQPRAVSTGRIVNANPLPHQVLCELRITVGYFDADDYGKPVGQELLTTDVCTLFTGSPPDLPPTLSVRLRELPVLVGQNIIQTVEVRQFRGSAPSLRLVYPDTLVDPSDPILDRLRPQLPVFQKALTAAFSAQPGREELEPTVVEFRFPIHVKLPTAEKNLLGELEGGLTVPCEAVIDGAKPSRWLLKLEAESRVFPGWVVIDFGTTNSTVTIHDTQQRIPFLGLPEEQEDFLRKRLVAWLRSDAAEALKPYGRQYQAEWKKLLTQSARSLNLPSAEELPGWLERDPEHTRLYELIAQLESNLRIAPEPMRRAAATHLSHFLTESLREPTLARFQVYPMKIDLDQKQTTVSSEMEIIGIEARQNDRFPKVLMGTAAQKGRLAAIGRADNEPLERVLGRFHASPKRYFGSGKEPFTIEIDGHSEVITYDQLMRAGWGKLLEFAKQAAVDAGGFSEGPFRRAVITYPTVAPPSVRQTIQKLLRDLRIADVQTDYDEAVASAIFYVMQEYNTYPELGLESFKARSVYRDKDGNPYQNVLVFDIGGGTTDVALIRLTLSEEAVFAPNEDRGAGGRYYKLTPTLLRATGHMQLGGELMTLRLFLLLKATIADKLLQLTQEKKLELPRMRSILEKSLPEQALDSTKKGYRPGWLRETVEQENPDSRSEELRKALTLAEEVIPTRWREASNDRASRLQAFYTLWEIAETAKKQLGGKRPGIDDAAPREPYVIKANKINELLNLYDNAGSIPHQATYLEVRLTQDQMEEAIKKVVDEAVKIAIGALESLPADEKVDWLILSGQSCNLILVDREIRQQFQQSNKFVWNQERVTFLPKYAKLSTSIGACYAENQRRYRFPPQSSKNNLRKGINTLYFDIDNLFSYLPCSILLLADGGNSTTVFKAGEQLRDLQGIDDEDLQRAQARSPWDHPPLTLAFYRRDYVGGTLIPWCHFSGKDLADSVGLTPGQWQNQIKVQYEIDHRLNIEILAFRTDLEHPTPHLQLTGREEQLQLTAALSKVAERMKSTTSIPPLFSPDGKLQWRIGVGDGTSVRQWLFEPGQLMTQKLHTTREGKSFVRVIVSPHPIEAFTDEGTLVVWGSLPGAKGEAAFGKMSRPGDSRPHFQRFYRPTLDETGMLRLHPGEPAYWESNDPTCLIHTPGRVLRRPAQPSKRETDEERNPFTGGQ